MPGEHDGNADIRELYARAIVMDVLFAQLLQRTAVLSGSPEAFVRGLMGSCEATLHATLQAAEPEQRQRAGDALRYFNDYSMRLIAALSRGGTRQ